MAKHTCPCGKHLNPGDLIGTSGRFRFVLVKGTERTWLEVRTAGARDGVLCTEPLLAALVVPTEAGAAPDLIEDEDGAPLPPNCQPGGCCDGD